MYSSHKSSFNGIPKIENIEQVAGIEKIDGDDVILKDKSIVHADVIILATGYR